MRESIPERFWKRVADRSSDECWKWLGQTNSYGYGFFLVEGKRFAAHRYSYLIHKGKIPDKMCVCHTCDNPICINPSHLWIGTIHDNIKDRDSKGRGNKGKKYRILSVS